MTAEIDSTQADELSRFLHRAAMGDSTAFELLYRHTASAMYALALRMLRRRDWADDVMQEAYVKIWHNASEYIDERGSVMGWMTTILRYRAIDKLRRENTSRLTDDDIDELDIIEEGSDPQLLITLQCDSTQLHDCLEELREQQRQCITAAFFDGYTYEQLSERLGTPLGTVKSWVRRGLQSLRRCMEP